MSHIVAFVLCLAAFAALAAAMDRPQADLFGRELSPGMTRGLRIAGAVLLMLALALLVSWQGWALGLVLFSGHTSAAAGAVYFALLGWARRTART